VGQRVFIIGRKIKNRLGRPGARFGARRLGMVAARAALANVPGSRLMPPSPTTDLAHAWPPSGQSRPPGEADLADPGVAESQGLDTECPVSPSGRRFLDRTNHHDA